MTSASPNTAKRILLICSVGGTPEPIVAAIRHCQPTRIRFLSTVQTRDTVEAALAAVASAGCAMISPGCTDETLLRDPQDLQQTLRDLRPLDHDVQSWQQRDENHAVVVDFTGGTKVMSAALALIARRWTCTFAYVGGQERNKNGVGVVVSGREQHINQFNPWDALGYQAVEDAVAVFNHGGYAAAAALLDGAVKNAAKPEVKRELSTLKAVVDAYAAWDRFDHREAELRFADALKYRNDLAAIFADPQTLIARLEQHGKRVAHLAKEHEPTLGWVEDLLHNAHRRAAEHRFDDAVARLYRATEALAQVRLRTHHGIPDTKAVPLEQLTADLQEQWGARARDGAVMLGLRDAFTLLGALGDELGTRFVASDLGADQKSPLVARNRSILAHGFQPVGKPVYDQLSKELSALATHDACDADDWQLPTPQ